VKKIRWKRANDDFVESHDGHWRITPLYWGCVSAQMYELWRDGKRVASHCSTQREAKEDAERLASENA
jgi:hypothetical protein